MVCCPQPRKPFAVWWILYGKQKNKMHFLIFFLFLSALLGGMVCPSDGCSAQSQKVIAITDVLGKKVEILLPAQRIVVINGDAAEIICALGAEKSVVGISSQMAKNGTLLFSDLAEKTVVGSSTGPSIEKIIELQPDLVIAYELWIPEEAFEAKLAPLGIPVVRMYCYRIDRLYEEIRILGMIVGKQDAAAAYIRFLDEILNKARTRLEGLHGNVRIYCESYAAYQTVSDGSGADKLLDLAGVQNIAAGQPVLSPIISAEWVAAKNPDVIVKVASSTYVKNGYGIKDIQAIDSFRNELIGRPAWSQTAAVQNGRVYILSSELWVGPRAPLGILYIARWAYPELFKDLDPEALHRQWLMKWHHKRLEGIYAYP